MYIMYTMYRTCAKLLPSAVGRAINRQVAAAMDAACWSDGNIASNVRQYQPVSKSYTT